MSSHTHYIKVRNIYIISVIIFLLVIIPILNIISFNNDYLNPKDNTKNPSYEPIHNKTEYSLDLKSDLVQALPGELKWSIQIADEELSTPAICDLNPTINTNENDFEVVVASAANCVAAVDKNGDLFWSDLPGGKFTDCIIDNGNELAQGLDRKPPPFFSSVTPAELMGDPGAELLIGEKDGVLCLNSDGTKYWTDKGSTDGYYFSTPAVTDLEGDFQGIDEEGNDVGYREDLEIIIGSDNNVNADAFIECWKANGDDVFRYEVDVPFEHAFLTCGIVTTELDGWFQGDEDRLEDLREADPNGRPETLYADLLMSTQMYPARIWKHIEGGAYHEYYEAAFANLGQWCGHETYATPAVGNFIGGPELEFIIGHGSGAMSWQSSDGTVRMYRQDGSEIVDAYSTGPAPSSVFSSPAVCDAQNFDKKNLDEGEIIDYEVFFGCDNGAFYSLSTTDLSVLWSYQTNGRILSSPAILNIDFDDSLEVVVGSNDGLVYCFECDPMEYDYNGMPHPKDDGIEDYGGKTGAYDILWTFDTKTVSGSSGEIGISSPVVGDLDRDGQLEVIVGDTGGRLYCISAGGTCVPGQVDWPMFHCDLNNTGFYKTGNPYGVYIDSCYRFWNGKEKLKKSIRPGETVSYCLMVKNIGVGKTHDGPERFWLEIDQDIWRCGEVQFKPDWPAPTLSGKDVFWSKKDDGDTLRPYVILSLGQYTEFTLSITAPWNSELKEICIVDVMAQSENDSFARDKVITTTTLELDLDFEIDILEESVKDPEDDLFGNKVLYMNPSDKATIEIKIENTGNFTDYYDLKIESELFVWKAYFKDTLTDQYTIGPLGTIIMENQSNNIYFKNETIVELNIESPAGVQESEIVILKVVATSQHSRISNCIDNITKFDYLVVKLNPIALELRCNQPIKYVDIGNNVTFEIKVLNHGVLDYFIELEHSPIEDIWEIEFQDENYNSVENLNSTIFVETKDEMKILVVISAPTFVEAGSKLNVTVSAITSDNSTLDEQDFETLTVIVSNSYDIIVTLDPLMQIVDPGANINYSINIENQGNSNDLVIITPMKLEANWKFSIKLNGNDCVASKLLLNETLTFQIQMTIPIDQLAGTYTTKINVTSLGDREIAEFSTEINKRFDLSIYGVLRSKYTNEKELNRTLRPEPGVGLGSTLDFEFEVALNGNAADWITLYFEPLISIQTEDVVLGFAQWSEFENLNWKASFFRISNTEVMEPEFEEMDFSKDLDISNETGSIGYLHNGNKSVGNLKLHLGVDQRIWIKFQMTIPQKIPDILSDLPPNKITLLNFALKCILVDPNSQDKDINLNNNKVLLTLRILYPDLMIKDKKLNHPSSISSGSLVTISAEVVNSGDIKANSVVVTLYIDNTELESQTIKILEKGQSRLIPFSWEASSGDHELIIKVDPENTIVEKYETNNNGKSQIEVRSENFLGFLGNYELRLISLILFGVICLIIILVKLKSKKDKKKD